MWDRRELDEVQMPQTCFINCLSKWCQGQAEIAMRANKTWTLPNKLFNLKRWIWRPQTLRENPSRASSLLLVNSSILHPLLYLCQGRKNESLPIFFSLNLWLLLHNLQTCPTYCCGIYISKLQDSMYAILKWSLHLNQVLKLLNLK